MKRYADRGRKETEVWKKGDRVLLSTKDLVFKERPTKKLTERYVGPYAIEEVVSSNAVKLRLPSSVRIHLVVNVSRIVCYKEQVDVITQGCGQTLGLGLVDRNRTVVYY